jgi:hypothetical protein
VNLTGELIEVISRRAGLDNVGDVGHSLQRRRRDGNRDSSTGGSSGEQRRTLLDVIDDGSGGAGPRAYADQNTRQQVRSEVSVDATELCQALGRYAAVADGADAPGDWVDFNPPEALGGGGPSNPVPAGPPLPDDAMGRALDGQVRPG